MKGQLEYALRMKGYGWIKVGEQAGCSAHTAHTRAMRYALRHSLKLKADPKPVKPRTRSRKSDAPRWHKMHLGKGMVSEAIAKKENVSIELVRKTLRAYREQLFG